MQYIMEENTKKKICSLKARDAHETRNLANSNVKRRASHETTDGG